MSDMAAIVLAAGQGTRMRSQKPKVLHEILGRPLIAFPLQLAVTVGARKIVTVVGHGRDAVKRAVVDALGEERAVFAHQKEQRGTGHAVMTALGKLRGHKGPVLILSGDVPLLDLQSLNQLKRIFNGKIAFLSFMPPDPNGYGRVIREDGKPVAIREHRDCSPKERRIGEVNAGIYLVDADFLRKSVKKLTSNNDQNELYLTDLVAMAAETGDADAAVAAMERVAGINDRAELWAAESRLMQERNLALMRGGVSMIGPETIRVSLGVEVGEDTTLMPGVHLAGRTVVGKGCTIEPGCILTDTIIEDNVTVKAYSVCDGATVRQGAEVGPMARLRPGADVGAGARIGNWVEVKNTRVGSGSKANHLAYLGDGDIGEGVNVGAGTIFCNYDGFSKHRTVLEDGVFIGSDSQLIAPVTIGRGAYVASGSTITTDVPADALALSRVRQSNRKRGAALLKQRLAQQKARRLASEGAGDKGRAARKGASGK